jgi:hypothetical protein
MRVSVDIQNIPCATVKRRGAWVISIYLCAEERSVVLCILTNKIFRGLEILVEAVGFDVVGDQLADPVLVRQLVRVGPRLNLHLL